MQIYLISLQIKNYFFIIIFLIISCSSKDEPSNSTFDISGCLDLNACNYNSDATMDDGSCNNGVMCLDGSYECDSADCPDETTGHYEVELVNTGSFQLIIFQETITTLDQGDEIGIFDANGVVETCNPDDGCIDPIYGEVLVGSGMWSGQQFEISAIESVDVSQFGGPVTNGGVDGNPVVIKVWKASEEMEYTASATWSSGTGVFGDLIIAISEVIY